ncbi:alpha/beta fold hydrolase [Synechococcus sp. 8F6]|uniref:alpha/beta hydrolase family protein n=1 Tax=Synechococcus sp. 8F6 TaxID=2025606 RepID=UPI0013031677|nr:alpha/beta fold hydrolase [Synechococcus sp. 8F6]
MAIRSGVFALAASALLAPTSARAIETIKLRLPLLETDFVIRVSELRSPQALMAGDSDLAELDRASGGAIGQKLKAVMQSNLPLELGAVLRNAQGSPLLEQVLLLVGALGDIDGLPEPLQPAQFEAAMQRAAAQGGISLLDVLEQLPGDSVTVQLGRLGSSVQRFRAQRRQADQLVASLPAVTSQGPWLEAGRFSTARRELTIAVKHRPEPLAVVVLESSASVPASAPASDRLVVISHGLWDDPSNFEGWASHLASHGYTVVLPRHPGSDQSQQRAMLAGKAPPPSPLELALRPKDVSAVIDAAADGRLGLRRPVNTQAVLVAGHSWGATTALQLAGARPTPSRLKELCDEVGHPSRNLSWVLQCNFVGSAESAALVDSRVLAAVAVSPPMLLLFDVESVQTMPAKVLVVSGNSDWVVPSGPEAIEPMGRATRSAGSGHRLVLAERADHFNLRSPQGDGGGALRGLLLAWFNAAAQAGPGVTPQLPAGGWGSSRHPLRDVTTTLPQLAVPAVVQP